MSNTQSRRDVLAGGASIAAASLAFPLTRAEPGSSATETAFNSRRQTFVLGARKSDWDALRRRLRLLAYFIGLDGDSISPCTSTSKRSCLN